MPPTENDYTVENFEWYIKKDKTQVTIIHIICSELLDMPKNYNKMSMYLNYCIKHCYPRIIEKFDKKPVPDDAVIVHVYNNVEGRIKVKYKCPKFRRDVSLYLRVRV